MTSFHSHDSIYARKKEREKQICYRGRNLSRNATQGDRRSTEGRGEMKDESIIESQVKCSECGEELVIHQSGKHTWEHTFVIEIEPCSTCIHRAKEEVQHD